LWQGKEGRKKHEKNGKESWKQGEAEARPQQRFHKFSREQEQS